MGSYEDTLKDIETTIGIVPGFMKGLPEDVLVQDWPLFKKYSLGESVIPAKYREMIGLAVSANIKCPYCRSVTLTSTHVGLCGLGERQLPQLALSPPSATLPCFRCYFCAALVRCSAIRSSSLAKVW